jgi:cobalt-zinc-cadmium efflux system protein
MLVALALTGLYTIAEAVGGKVSGSLALLADAGHMLSDTAALALAVFAMWVAQKPRDARRTYGYQRTEILAALANAATLLAVSVSILVEAYQRLHTPAVISTKLMMAIATGGLVNNLVCMGVLSAGKDESLNLRGAWLHLLTDALGSVGAIVSGFLVGQFGWAWADPVASALIALLVMRSAWSLLSETVSVLMEHAPEHVNVDEVRGAMVAHDNVGDVHDLHVWTITSGLVCLSAHVVTHADAETQQAQLAELTRILRERFRIDHVTLQLEHASYPADTCAGCD